MSTLTAAVDLLNSMIVWHPSVKLSAMRQFDSIIHELKAMIDERERVALESVVTLDSIASWPDGAQVDCTYDEPHAAQLARTQLAAFGITGPLNPENDDDDTETSARLRDDGSAEAA